MYMTDDEILRQKYISLQKKLYRIRNKIRGSLEEHDDLFSFVKLGILINGEAYCCDELYRIKTKLNSINKDLTYNVIPKINNKI